MSKRTVEDVEGGRRRGRDDYEEEGEQSEAGSGFQKADAATLAQRRLLRLRPEARQQQQQGAGAFASINAVAANPERFKQSAESANKPFQWGSGFYNPPQPQQAAPSYDLVRGGEIDNKPEKDAQFEDAEDKKAKKEETTTSTTTTTTTAAAPAWTANPFTTASSSSSSSTNPFAANAGSSSTTTTTTTTSDSSVNPFGGANSFSFSFAPPPSSMPTTTTSTTSAGNGDSTTSGKAALAAAPTTTTDASAESETVLYETEQCKLYLLTKDEETKKTEWKDRGSGAFKVVQLKNSNDKGYLIMRNAQTRKFILSCPIDDSLKIGQTQEMQLMFTSAAALDVTGGPPPKDTVQSFLLRAKQGSGKEVIETIVKNIKQEQEKSAAKQ